jgi:hypothetical protein
VSFRSPARPLRRAGSPRRRTGRRCSQLEPRW